MAGGSSKARGTKAPLDRDVFIDAALRIASRPHSLSLTYRDLGNELDVDPTAIYRHFQSKESLLQELLDRVYQMALARMTGRATAWEGRLVEFATSTLDTFLEYPAIGVSATSLTTGGPGELDSMELMLSCFSEAGLNGRAAAEQYAIFGSYVLAGAAGLARDQGDTAGGGSYEWFAGPMLAEPTHHPLAASSRDHILALEQRKIFLAGVKQIIAAAKAAAP
ncbi:TetR/AcrR family transcriptional regulator [Paeniglutamicibacter sp. NPDC091659]|uniref:TetR/AcrR family transcriptional regulator n=1 Tax=Paeniglutamicibacter sp. NPDC091659 TaxID=3364389 RepID=UPI0037F4B75F